MSKALLFNKWDKSNDWTYTWECIYRWKTKYLKCVCKCWSIWYIQPHYFKIWDTKSCQKCARIQINKWDRYWRLTLTWKERDEIRWIKKVNVRFVECICDCWNIIRTRLSWLRYWNTISCWCYHKQRSSESSSINNKTHWESKTKFYGVFKTIKARCNNPHVKCYNCYWWRWIKCERESYEDFKSDMYKSYIEHVKIYWEKNTTIDRINVNWNYCIENCRWATYKEQANNTRKNIILEYKWIKYTLQQLSEFVWISPGTIMMRIKKWYTIERAIEEPLHK